MLARKSSTVGGLKTKKNKLSLSQERHRPVGGEKFRHQLSPTQGWGTELVKSVQAFLWGPRSPVFNHASDVIIELVGLSF